MNNMRTIIVMALLLAAPGLQADPAVPPGPSGPDVIGQHLYPPDLVMRFAGEIALDDRQRNAIKEAVRTAQSRFTDLQFDMQSEAERLVRLLQARPVDENAVLAQVDRVLGLERDIKKAQLSLLVRIKNLLNPAQQEKLNALRGG
ncbi:MAG: periplasmic heavy metal sensor [Gemmatimonadetes bacterium]|nr:periplasmic heavy metal sensor [Gemmatimonadota bacterium]